MDPFTKPHRIRTSLLIAGLVLLLLQVRHCVRPGVEEIGISPAGLSIDQVLYPQFSDLTDPAAHWGKARQVAGTINDLLIWDKQGLCIFREAGSDRVVSLHLAMVPSGDNNRPKHPYPATFMLNQMPLSANMPANALENAGFKALADSGWYKLTLGNYRLSAFTQDGLLKTLELAPVD